MPTLAKSRVVVVVVEEVRSAPRAELLARTFVDVADTLVADFYLLDFLTRLTARTLELFELAEAGLLLADPKSGVNVAASSSHRMELLELFEIQHDEGPCLDSFRTGELVRAPDLTTAVERWPRFAPEAISRGYGSVYAVPMRLRAHARGCVAPIAAAAIAQDLGLKQSFGES